ncbi:MAG: hypothetical protein AB7U71_22205, partial [Comamonas sp.]
RAAACKAVFLTLTVEVIHRGYGIISALPQYLRSAGHCAKNAHHPDSITLHPGDGQPMRKPCLRGP